MKKTIIIAVIALLGVCREAGAQVYIGGSFSVHSSFQDTPSTSVSISPDIGYGFGKWNVGAMFSAHTVSFADSGLSSLRIGITPYAEYYVFSAGPVSLFVEGGVGLLLSRYFYTDQEPTSRFIFNPYLSPGIEITLADHFSVMCQLGRLEWDSEGQSLGFSMSGEALNLGLYYSF